MRAEIISVGNELLKGYTPNTNTTYLSKRLSDMGFEVHRHSSVGDYREDIFAALELAVSRSHIIIFTGGLGPTDDDLTKEAVAEVLGLQLIHNEAIAKNIETYFTSRGAKMPDNNLKQAQVIEGSEPIFNAFGTAPGIFLRRGNQAIILMPGPPNELEPMFDNEVAPQLELFIEERVASRELKVFGIGESDLELKIKHLLYAENPRAALYAGTGEVSIRISAYADEIAIAQLMCNEHAQKIRNIVGEFIYSDDGSSMNKAVVETLKRVGAKVAVAESCTGGLLSASLTEIPGVSDVFELGVISYADWAKNSLLDVERSILTDYSAISSVVAAEMAKGAMKNSKADIGVGITGIAGPTSEGFFNKTIGTVYIAVSDHDGVVVKEFRFGATRTREFIREISVKSALDMIRRFVTNLDIAGSREFRLGEIADLDNPGRPKLKVSSKTTRAIVSAIAVIVAGGSLYLGGNSAFEYFRGSVYNTVEVTYEQAAQNNNTAAGLTELKQTNQDTIGWLSVGDTINTVVVSSADNEYYTDHDFEKSENALGCPFLDMNITNPDIADNNIIYGTSINDDLMFGPLIGMSEREYALENMVVDFETLNGSSQYKVVSVYYANANDQLGTVQNFAKTEFEDNEDLANFIIDFKIRSIYNIDVDIKTGDRFLTLATPLEEWGDTYLVVVTRAVRPGEVVMVFPDSVTINPAPLYHDQWYVDNGSSSVINIPIEQDKWRNWLSTNDQNFFETIDFSEMPAVDAESPLLENVPDYFVEGIIPYQTDESYLNATNGVVSITDSATGEIVTNTPLEIVSMIVEAEIGSALSVEAIKAQAVATTTYLKYMLRFETAPEFPVEPASSIVRTNVSEVIDTAMYYNGNIIFSPYCALVAQGTQVATNVFGADLPYLNSVESAHDTLSQSFNYEYSLTVDQMKAELEQAYPVTLGEDPSKWIQFVSTNQYGYVNTVSIDGTHTTTGTDLRKTLGLRSSAIELAFDPATQSFNLTTAGYGHGVGMSQYGAHYYAQVEEWDYIDILEHYYLGIEFGGADW